MLERLNEELTRRTHVIRMFPNEAGCVRLIRARACEKDDEQMDGACYLNLETVREPAKAQVPRAP
jgi:transposase-like protein